ncbi:MAG: glycine dehydrogenase (aminomethyl-transferring) [Bacteroidetes bacterium]|nr:MAG: glycine dehydrogenase (aminomethyl-transferring) [Bacteroidota bacterium]PIE88221.1 MAG: glycine dehydrogenase (aminomethyl-transferring) [Bacteroidota bacterium]
MITHNFAQRHIGLTPEDREKMLQKIGVASMEELIDKTIPPHIRFKKELDLPLGINEYEFQRHIAHLGEKNKIFRSYIGMGYYNTILPGVILRNVLENPGWYTAYTPYQAEISQGRLEALLNFQTMVSDLTAMPLSNCSLLDEGTAAAEAMIMAFNARPRKKVKANAVKFFVSETLFPQTLSVMEGRAAPLGIEIVKGDCRQVAIDETFFGALVQYPDGNGAIHDYSDFVEAVHGVEGLFCVAADILSLALLRPPGEWGADVVVGSTQRFGIPMGFGGPHAAYLASKEAFKRHIPGRIIGISVDRNGNPALRMALQTREQHIKRERATSNICTAQALLAMMAGFYAAYHGPKGIQQIARHVNILTGVLNNELKKYGYQQKNESFFDTLCVELPETVSEERIHEMALEKEMNFRYFGTGHLGISLDETTTLADVNEMLEIFALANGKPFHAFVCNPTECQAIATFPTELKRTSEYLTHPVFNSYHSETDMMRYMKKLENRDLALNRTMIPLGSCTMKLNAASWLFHLSNPSFGAIHPFVPAAQAEGYLHLINNFEAQLCEITGFSGISFQPNSGASGEYTGLMTIRAYHNDRGEGERNICLIPSSAHGTNPASSVMAGMRVVVVQCDDHGNIDVEDFRAKAEQHKDHLAAAMITYPSTHGVFEEAIVELVKIVHDNGGLVYMDGANMNAQVGYTSPGHIGADVCHLNLHKTFGIPHGGGGPGVGPIGVAEHLLPFLPGNPVAATGGEKAIRATSSAPFGSAMVIPISYGYVTMLGAEGLREATANAILNANYIRVSLQEHYKVLYTGTHGMCAHELILDCNEFHHTAGIEVIEIAKRLMDYGFHAPTVAFPVVGTLMVEPTESEPLREMDRFIEAMIKIREEIRCVENGTCDKVNNVVKNAPHTCEMVTAEEWTMPYRRAEAAFPLEGMKEDKYWPPVTKIDDGYGDRNLVCVCQLPPLSDYEG